MASSRAKHHHLESHIDMMNLLVRIQSTMQSFTSTYLSYKKRGLISYIPCICAMAACIMAGFIPPIPPPPNMFSIMLIIDGGG